MNKKIRVGRGELPLWGYFFYVGSLFSPRGGHAIFSVCSGGGGGLIFCMGGGALLGLPPITIFAGATYIFNVSGSWRFEFFWRELFDLPQKIAPPPQHQLK